MHYPNALGEEVVYNKIPAATFRSFGFPGADDLGNMFQFYDEFEKELNKSKRCYFFKTIKSGAAVV